MKTIILLAAEAAALRDKGWIATSYWNSRDEIQPGDTVAILEPWAMLTAPPGAYATDLPPRYIYQADRTAEPYRFRYQAPETMPLEAVKRYATVAWIACGVVQLDLIGSQSECKSTII